MRIGKIGLVILSATLLPAIAGAADVKVKREHGSYEYKYKTEECDFKYNADRKKGRVSAKAKGDCPSPASMPRFNPPAHQAAQPEEETHPRRERLRDELVARRDERRREATRDCRREVARDTRRYGAATKRTARNAREDLRDCGR